jgi:glucose-1-phosphate thymidylyltransferase
MKVIIPVAGAGTRLRPHTLTQPKVLMNVAGHPMIYYIVQQLIEKKLARDIIFITGNRGDEIRHYLNKTFQRKFTYVEQEQALGLGHAVLCARDRFDPIKNESALIILGDTLFDVDLKDMVKSRHSVIGVKKVDDPRRFGVVEKNKYGYITRFVEKPATPEVSPSNEAIVGLYYIKNSTLLFNSLESLIKKEITTKGEFQLTDALEIMISKKDKMKTYTVFGWLDCGKKETILETNAYLLKKSRKKYKIKNTVIKNPVFIGENVTLDNCVIGPNATINSNCHIKKSTVVNSIIDENCRIQNSVITDSLLGRHVKVTNKKGIFSLGEYSEA